MLTNTMIDAADPDELESLDLISELVSNLKSSENRLIEIVSSTSQADIVDFALKLNDDCQSVVKRFKQLQKGQRPSAFTPSHLKNNFDNPKREEAKVELPFEQPPAVQSR